jgi:hypothetical protein
MLTSCGTYMSCDNEFKGRSLSPDGKLAAVVFSRNCGATVGDNYQVSVVSASEEPTGKGNVVVLDQAPDYSPSLKPVWNGNTTLIIPIPVGARVFSKTDRANGVGIIFKQIRE